MELIDYTIGDDIVSLETFLVVKENEIYQAKGLSHTTCCNIPIVDVGIKPIVDNKGYGKCVCKKQFKLPNSNHWLAATRFKKLDTLVDISELTDILQEPVTFKV